MPKINASVNVNNVGASPIKKLDTMVINTNIEMVFMLLDNVQLINLEYHFDLIGCDGFFSSFLSNKYQGVHSIPKPNGKLQMIFQFGILNCCIRRILT